MQDPPALPQDAPPSYDTLETQSLPLPQDEKAERSRRSGELHPLASSSPQPSPSSDSKSHAASSAWWSSWVEPPAVKEVRKTIVGLLHDLVRGGDAECILAVLDSCAGTCRSYGISLSSILQERSAAGHTPLYWAVVNRPHLVPSAQDMEYFRAILTYAAPLSTATVEDVRLACLHSPNNVLFQGLGRIPAFSPLSEQEKLIMGQTVPLDEVDVQDFEADLLHFSVRFKIPMFQKRMRIAGDVTLEFIATGRLWQFSILVARQNDYDRLGNLKVTPGRLAVKLTLLPGSPPTGLVSTLVIEDRAAHGVSPSAASSPELSSKSPSSPSAAVNPPIQVQLQSGKKQLVPGSGSWGLGGMIAVSLESNDQANTLQIDRCPYVGNDDTLIASLNVMLDAAS
ncbi:hypothetical protein K466DRAFT_624289 [Polyporus arcularius HHB13444]|uniref:Uncharacterized protein n=1 Tax=Polyporus arcularius HHB13444 TaxID=1314778 RepID=A0A5C3P4W5_9APHY|nr:hypothetical protein K466DRAFT_624289 [Polyporus arcularius HHB13444]